MNIYYICYPWLPTPGSQVFEKDLLHIFEYVQFSTSGENFATSMVINEFTCEEPCVKTRPYAFQRIPADIFPHNSHGNNNNRVFRSTKGYYYY